MRSAFVGRRLLIATVVAVLGCARTGLAPPPETDAGLAGDAGPEPRCSATAVFRLEACEFRPDVSFGDHDALATAEWEAIGSPCGCGTSQIGTDCRADDDEVVTGCLLEAWATCTPAHARRVTLGAVGLTLRDTFIVPTGGGCVLREVATGTDYLGGPPFFGPDVTACRGEIQAGRTRPFLAAVDCRDE